MTEEQKSLKWLSSILDILLSECPWDSVQTIDSLRYLTIEEVYELSESIIAGNREEMGKEMGDLFMHLLFYSKIAEDEERFSTADVLNAVCDKLIDRHPFIYKPESYKGESWEQIKMHEGRKSVLEGVPTSLPPLVKAVRMQEKASGIGVEATLSSEKEEIAIDSITSGHEPTEESFGNLLFNLVHWAHEHGINADTALARANLRFQDKVKEFEKKQ